jgi:hypothetical protein
LNEIEDGTVTGDVVPKPERKIRRLDELVTDSQIEELVARYSLGQEVWWQRAYVVTQQLLVGPDGEQVTINLPVTTIILGMKGHLIGPEYYLWWVIHIDAYPSMEKAEQNILEGIEGMRSNKAKQVNDALRRRKS